MRSPYLVLSTVLHGLATSVCVLAAVVQVLARPTSGKLVTNRAVLVLLAARAGTPHHRSTRKVGLCLSICGLSTNMKSKFEAGR